MENAQTGSKNAKGRKMKRYTMSFADSIKHVPEYPERTAQRSFSWDVMFQVWPSRAAMLKTIEMQGRRAPRSDDWREWKPRHAPTPLERLRHHVSGAIERGEKEAIVEKR